MIKIFQKWRCRLAVFVGKTAQLMLRLLGRAATNFPGRLALRLAPGLLAQLTRGRQLILVTGTNGKTTTVRLLARIFQEQDRPVIANFSGANMETGLVATLLDKSRLLKKNQPDPVIIFEIDEAYFAKLAGKMQPAICLVTNIFRDQQDRFGDPDQTRDLLAKGLEGLQTELVLCADDPLCASLGRLQGNQVHYFGLAEKAWPGLPADLQQETPFCLFCGERYRYFGLAFAHLGDFSCPSCGYSRPRPDLDFLPGQSGKAGKISFSWQGRELTSDYKLSGIYNAYNAAAAVLAGLVAGLPFAGTVAALGGARPAFGRQERFPVEGREVCLILVKNPGGMEQALAHVRQTGDAGGIIFLLNDAETDGRDISWIWDVDFASHLESVPLGVGGSRRADLALRFYYGGLAKTSLLVEGNRTDLFDKMLAGCPAGRCLYILPNYTAMLAMRQDLARRFELPDFWQ